jgi:hypothetical protein
MKYKFNFIQIANWLFICRQNLLKIKESILNNDITKEEAIQKLESQKQHLLLIKDIINRKIMLHGIQKDFIINYLNFKKELNIEDNKGN